MGRHLRSTVVAGIAALVVALLARGATGPDGPSDWWCGSASAAATTTFDASAPGTTATAITPDCTGPPSTPPAPSR